MTLNLILNLILIKEFLHVGLAIATSVSAWVNATILFLLLKKLGYKFDKSIIIDLSKVLFSSFGCVFIFFNEPFETLGFAVLNFSGRNNLLLIITILTGSLVYLIVCYYVGINYIYKSKWLKKSDKELVFFRCSAYGKLTSWKLPWCN